MSRNNAGKPVLIVVLSVLTVLSIAITAGLLLMQTREIPGDPLGSILSLLPDSSKDGSEENPVIDPASDPIGWARQGAPYPPLMDPEEETGDASAEQTHNQTAEDAAEQTVEESPEETEKVQITFSRDNPPPSVSPAPASSPRTQKTPPKHTYTAAPKAPPASKAAPAPSPRTQRMPPKHTHTAAPKALPTPRKPAYRDITVNAYWVQVFSSSDSSRAESIREELADLGLSSRIQAREVNGLPRYRVRLGAFKGESEAEYYAETVRSIPGCESSYVVIAPVTRRVPAN